jgi:hypothetical protein
MFSGGISVLSSAIINGKEIKGHCLSDIAMGAPLRALWPMPFATSDDFWHGNTIPLQSIAIRMVCRGGMQNLFN